VSPIASLSRCRRAFHVGVSARAETTRADWLRCNRGDHQVAHAHHEVIHDNDGVRLVACVILR